MANSYVEYTANGSTNQFDITFSYIDRTHIKVYINNVEDTSFTFINDNRIQTSSMPSNGQVVKVDRDTPTTARLVDFQDGSVLTETDLDKSANQNFFIAQETEDEVASKLGQNNSGVFDAINKRIINVGTPTAGTDAANKTYIDTQTNNAFTSASNAATSETNAAASATAAAASATTASTKATEAATSANDAATSETACAIHATTATNSVASSTTQATNAASSASAAFVSETNAAASATASANSASAAATSETNSATSATNSATSATNSATSATAASAAQSSAESARDSTLAAFDNFDDRYLGAKTSDPSTDNDGNTLVAGTLYFNSTSGAMKVYTGSTWVDAYSSGTTFLAKTNNLSDLPNAVTARTNLGVAIGSDVQAHSSVLDATTASYTTALDTKLSGIETGATADQSDAEIKTAYENNANTNAFTDALLTKLNGIETSATADQSDAEIKTAYENNNDTNAFTDAEKTKLSGIETNATADQTQSEITALVESAALDMGSNDITTTGKIKFANMYAQLSDLPNATTYHGMFAHVHATGKGYFAHGGNWIELANNSQLAAYQTTSGLNSAVDTHLNQSTASSGEVLSWNGSDYDWISNAGYTDTDFDNRLATKDTGNLSEGSNLYYTDERVDDRVSNLLVAGTNVSLNYNDAANTLTINSTGGGGSSSSPEIYGFVVDTATATLQVTTTNGGNDNISSTTYATFDDVVYATTGFTWSITSSGELRATI